MRIHQVSIRREPSSLVTIKPGQVSSSPSVPVPYSDGRIATDRGRGGNPPAAPVPHKNYDGWTIQPETWWRS